MNLVTAEQMRAIETRAAREYGLTGDVLMENAAGAAVRHLMLRRGPGPARATVFCGKGNNGGDGWAVARLLTERGWKVEVYHPGLDVALSPESEANRRRAISLGIPNYSWDQRLTFHGDLVIDAILGTGVRGEIDGPIKQLIQAINGSGLPVLALDIPSGIASDTGQIAGVAVKASWTVAFGLLKAGEAVYPGKEYCGEVIVDPIGIPQALLEQENDWRTIDETTVGSMLPRRAMDTHKGKNGHLLVAGGSEGMTGAATLSALAGLRAGAGLVTLAKRPKVVFYEKPMEIMTINWNTVHLSDYNAVVFGPGLSTAGDGEVILERILATEDIPRVIDADGLNLLAARVSRNDAIVFKGPVVVTPHPGEMARLCRCTPSEVQAERTKIALEKAAEWKTIVVLKGAATLVATPEGRLWVNKTGNPGMSTAGTGDVLTGVIGALMAQGLKPEEAAVAGVYLHGMAGDLAAQDIGEVGLVASDLLERLPQALRRVKQGVPL